MILPENSDINDMSVEAMIEEIVSLRKILKGYRETMAQKDRMIESLQQKARQYYRAASDYVPPPENEYD